MNTVKDFAKKLRQLRIENHLTQEDLRTRLDDQGFKVSHISTISRWENGSRIPKIDIVEALEDILGANRGLLLRAARYPVEISPGESVSPQVDSVIVKQRVEHFTDLANIASLLINGLDNVSSPGWTTNRSRQGKYLLPNENAASGYDEITKEQLASRLNRNMAAILKDRDWFFRNCFIPHLKSVLPEELKTKLFYRIIEEQPYQLIELLRRLAVGKPFKGSCPVCKDWIII